MRSFARTYERYLKEFPLKSRETLEKLRNFIAQELPDAKIIMSRGVPVFYQNKKEIVAMSAQRQYFSIYFWKFNWKREFASQIKDLKTGSDCIRFTKFEQLPFDLIKVLIKKSVEAF